MREIGCSGRSDGRGTVSCVQSFGCVLRILLHFSALIVALGIVATVPDAYADVRYETKFSGVEGDLRDQLRAASQLEALEDKHPPTEAALQRRALSDLDRLNEVLHAAGYYDANLSYAVDQTKDPRTVTVTVDPGALYTLAKVMIETPDGGTPPERERVLTASFGLGIGGPATAEQIIDAEPQIAGAYTHRGWPFAKVTNRRVVVDTATKAMDVTYVLDVGPQASFGPVSIDGLSRLDRSYVERRIAWTQGFPYDQGQVESTRQTLVTSGLFASVVIEPAGEVGPDGEVPMRLRVTERPLHSLGAGVSYNTSEGISATLSWEDRNLFGHAEDLTITGRGGTTTDGLVANFRRPDALGYNRDFLANVTVEDLRDPAFRSLHQIARVGFEDHLTTHLVGDVSLEAEHARVDEKVDFRVYTLVGIPISLRQDATDDLLNPTRGYRAGFETTAYLRALGSNETFVQTRVNGSLYRRLTTSDTYILAVESTLGTTEAASLAAIPKDHRFYAGGGGSVRGFGFQKAGPLDQFFDPIGGKSLFETSFELRTKVTSTIGLVPFFDVGTDYPTDLPKPGGTLFYGAGIGVRYFTPIGPVRLDVAVPINPHARGDSPIQIYVSLGQAF
jgi:translocation and assembly module TamA